MSIDSNDTPIQWEGLFPEEENKRYTFEFTKKEVVFLSALLGTMDQLETVQILQEPLDAFGAIVAGEHYWDNAKALEYIQKDSWLVDNLYSKIEQTARQFKENRE